MGFIFHVIRRALILALILGITVIGASIVLNSEEGGSPWPTLSEMKQFFLSGEKDETPQVSELQQLRERTLAEQNPSTSMGEFEMGEALGGGYNYGILDVFRMKEIFGGGQETSQPMQIGKSSQSGQTASYLGDSLSIYVHMMKAHLERAMQGDKQSMIALAAVGFSILLTLFMVLRFFRLMLRPSLKKQRIGDMG